MQLSKHFTLREMTNSMTAQRRGIDNTPGAGEIKSLGDLCYEVLEPLRAHFDKDDPAGGWVHISYHESDSNRKQVLTFDGKKYTEGLPDMEWKDGKVVS